MVWLNESSRVIKHSLAHSHTQSTRCLSFNFFSFFFFLGFSLIERMVWEWIYDIIIYNFLLHIENSSSKENNTSLQTPWPQKNGTIPTLIRVRKLFFIDFRVFTRNAWSCFRFLKLDYFILFCSSSSECLVNNKKKSCSSSCLNTTYSSKGALTPWPKSVSNLYYNFVNCGFADNKA